MTLGARKAPMRRGKGLSRSKMKRKKRKASETLRIYGPPARRRWIKSLPCVASECVKSCGPCGGPIDNAHSVSGKGTGYKADAATIVPLCRVHHRAYDEFRAPFDTRESRAVIIGAAAAYDLSWTTRSEER